MFDDLVDALATDADRLRLPPPARLRAAGAARAHRRRIGTLGGAFVLVAAAIAGAAVAVASVLPPPPGPPPVAPAGSVSVAGSDPPPSPSSPPVGACAGSELTFVGVEQGAGMGSAFFTYTVRSSASCWLEGVPSLHYRRTDGATRPVPVTPAADGATRVTLAPGRSASFGVQTVNGYGGYTPGAPECAHPAAYPHLAVVLANGSTLALGDNGTLSIQCGGITVSVWTAAR